MAKDSIIDNDLGMKKALEELKKLGRLYAKVGFPEGSGTVKGEEGKEVDIATYATWNENGVTSSKSMLKKGKLWRIPPRPFLSQAIENNSGKTKELTHKLTGLVAGGKIDASAAIQRLAVYAIDIIRKSIASGNFKENSMITIHGLGIDGSARAKGGRWLRSKKTGKEIIKGKGEGKKPLTDSGTMKKSVNAVILENGTPIGRIK